MKHNRALCVNEMLPDIVGKTDEGTPVSLLDFKGRALAVFFIDSGISRTSTTIIKNIKRRIDEFLEFECSPIVISLESEEELIKLRVQEALPFLLISDFTSKITEAMCGSSKERAPATFVVNADSVIVATVPSLPPREQVSATIAALSRIVSLAEN